VDGFARKSLDTICEWRENSEMVRITSFYRRHRHPGNLKPLSPVILIDVQPDMGSRPRALRC
jgi:hypothetical protein